MNRDTTPNAGPVLQGDGHGKGKQPAVGPEDVDSLEETRK
jgi:hypothetical protein